MIGQCVASLLFLSQPSLELSKLEAALRAKATIPVVFCPSWNLTKTAGLRVSIEESRDFASTLREHRVDSLPTQPLAIRAQAFPIRHFAYYTIPEAKQDRTALEGICELHSGTQEMRKFSVRDESVEVSGPTGAIIPIKSLSQLKLSTPLRTPRFFEGEVLVVTPGRYLESDFVTAVSAALGTKRAGPDSNSLVLDPAITKSRWQAYLESTRRFAVNGFLTEKHEALMLAAKYANQTEIVQMLEDPKKFLDVLGSANIALPTMAQRCLDTYVLQGTHEGSGAHNIAFRERFISRIDRSDPRPILFRFYGSGHMMVMFPANDGKAYVAL